MLKAQICEWMDFFENVSDFYRSGLKWTWNKYEYGKEPWQSLALFLGGYAFERQGRSASYPHAAMDAVAEHKNALESNASVALDTVIWEDFSNRVGRGLNPKRCPLYPDNKSLLSRLRERNQNNIVTCARDLVRNGEMREAFDFLKSIRGIGPKIASFFLRDIKEVFDIKNIKMGERILLQPIDIWIERTIDEIAGKKNTKNETADFIVENSRNPERVNMGMWFFAATVCGSEYKHKRCLSRIEVAKHELLEYKDKAKQICAIL